MAISRVKAILKEASPETRAHILKWLARYYRDDGDLFSPSISTQQRRRIVLDGEAYWLVKIPQR